ncbi:MAG: nitrogen fixation protein NifH [Chloroflexi bacterium]|nr:nitrogen fixation protein NifH [Chloroflexota bacterium]MBM3175043.1 nitrogen fixation protein NifH [Chloroflexota bacterium]MBM4449914.1 nitrogen fixation protein NifH [Chloroflexota bacterium]
MKNTTEKNPLDWLLEPSDIGVQYLAMRYLIKANPEELAEAKKKAHSEGPIAQVLAKMHKEGYWEQPGAGYNPKYTGTVWSIILLAQLGASIDADECIATACSYLLEHTLTERGQFTINGLPSGTADCLQGNLCESLLDLGYEDPRLDKAFEWMARTVTGEGIAPMQDKTAPVRYYAGKCGPNFACGSNNKLPCAWGAVKVILAFSKLPKGKRTTLIDNAIKAGVDFLFSTDPAKADYPCGYSSKPSGNWWKFGFPVFYVTDLLQNVETLVGLGYGNDPRLANAMTIIRQKQDNRGRWLMEYDYTGKTWIDFGPKKQPNKWVTLRALRVLKAIEQPGDTTKF